ncbi:MAG: ATP-dependent Clp protease protease subunit, partial [Algoriphagus sp.]
MLPTTTRIMINKEEFRKYAIHNQGVSGTAFDQ